MDQQENIQPSTKQQIQIQKVFDLFIRCLEKQK